MRRVTVHVGDTERDAGKRYQITEKDVYSTERLALRALMLAVKAGADIPENIQGAGVAGIAYLGIQSLLGSMRYEELEPILAEMMDCVVMMPDKDHQQVTRPLAEGDIEDIETLFAIRRKIIELHFNFSKAGGESKTTQTSPSPAQERSGSSRTRTFHRSPGPPSRQGKPR